MARVIRATSMSWVGGIIASPASAASYEVENASLSPKLFDLVGGGVVGSAYAISRRAVGLRYGVDFDVILRGCDLTVGPHVGALLRACGFSEALVSGTSATYAASTTQGATRFLDDPIAGLVDPIDLTLNYDGLKLATLTNMVGRVTVDFSPPNFAYFRFHMEGNHANVFDTATAMVALASERQPIPLTGANDPILALRHAALTGTATNASPSATSLDASASNFLTLNVQPGMAISNDTDGSSATVVSVTSSGTNVVTTALSGGSDDTWTTGDTWSIGVEQEYPKSATSTGKFELHGILAEIGNTIDSMPGFGAGGYHRHRISDRGASMFTTTMREPLLTGNSTFAGFDWDRYTRASSADEAQYGILSYILNSAGTGGDKVALQVAGKAVAGVPRSAGPAGLAQLAVSWDMLKSAVVTSGSSIDLGGNGLTLQWT